jgi:hypothetical protein
VTYRRTDMVRLQRNEVAYRVHPRESLSRGISALRNQLVVHELRHCSNTINEQMWSYV